MVTTGERILGKITKASKDMEVAYINGRIVRQFSAGFRILG